MAWLSQHTVKSFVAGDIHICTVVYFSHATHLINESFIIISSAHLYHCAEKQQQQQLPCRLLLQQLEKNAFNTLLLLLLHLGVTFIISTTAIPPARPGSFMIFTKIVALAFHQKYVILVA